MTTSAQLRETVGINRSKAPFEEVYFDVQAEIDLTKHPGGIDATDDLVALCDIDATDWVLDVGCGVGMTPVYIAKKTGCRVTALDLRMPMIQRAVERATREKMGGQITFIVADACHLPFAEESFDVVMAESLFALIENQAGAMAEAVRVTKQEGAVGIAETIWWKTPTAELMTHLTQNFGRMIHVHFPVEWVQLLLSAGLHDIKEHNFPINLRSESVSRVQRMGLRHVLRVWRRFFRLVFTQPKYRRFLKEAISEPVELMRYWGYGVYVGKKVTDQRN